MTYLFLLWYGNLLLSFRVFICWIWTEFCRSSHMVGGLVITWYRPEKVIERHVLLILPLKGYKMCLLKFLWWCFFLGPGPGPCTSSRSTATVSTVKGIAWTSNENFLKKCTLLFLIHFYRAVFVFINTKM